MYMLSVSQDDAVLPPLSFDFAEQVLVELAAEHVCRLLPLGYHATQAAVGAPLPSPNRQARGSYART